MGTWRPSCTQCCNWTGERPWGLMHVGRGQFAAALEVQEQRRLVMSFLHHMAVQRLCKNPLEDKEIVGITNYLDFGLQVGMLGL